MAAVLIRLRPSGPWRMGPDSGDRDRVDRIYHSDSLYAAVCSAMASLGALDEWLGATARAECPAVRFSSCFPFQGNTLYVVPPQNVWPPAASSKVRWKGARFIPLKVVETLLAGQVPKEDAWVVDGSSECLMPTSAPLGSGLFRASVRSGAAVDRAGESVAVHSTACVEFAPGCGLWFAAEFADDAAREQWSERLKGALRLLADSGFGGERSRGWGRAEAPEFTDGELSDLLWKRGETVAGGAYWMLSLFHPSDNDAVDWQLGNYSLTTRGGRIESSAGWGQIKNTIRMVTEGSVLVAAAAPLGSVTNVAPEGFAHPVYRSGFGLALPVPVKVQAS